jgi:hypothetical protein
MQVVPLKKAFPLATDILSLYCLGPEQELDALRPDLIEADSFAVELIAGAKDTDRSFIEQIEDFAKQIDTGEDDEDVARYRAQGRPRRLPTRVRCRTAVAGRRRWRCSMRNDDRWTS